MNVFVIVLSVSALGFTGYAVPDRHRTVYSTEGACRSAMEGVKRQAKFPWPIKVNNASCWRMRLD